MTMAHYMNQDLFDSPKDAEIANLRRVIKDFRAYDEKRTKHYKELVRETNWLREELDIVSDDTKKNRKLKEQRSQIDRLEKIIDANQFKTDYPQETLDAVRLYKEKAAAVHGLEAAKAEIKKLKAEVSELVYKLNASGHGCGGAVPFSAQNTIKQTTDNESDTDDKGVLA